METIYKKGVIKQLILIFMYAVLDKMYITFVLVLKLNVKDFRG